MYDNPMRERTAILTPLPILALACLLSSCASEKSPKLLGDRYCSPEGLFCINAPGQPKVEGKPQDVPGLVSAYVKTYEWGGPDDMVYLVMSMDLALQPGVEGSLQAGLDNVVKGVGERMGGKAAGSTEVVLGGRKAKETIFDHPKGFRLAIRGLLIDTRIFLVVMGAPTADWDPAYATLFFDSFKL